MIAENDVIDDEMKMTGNKYLLFFSMFPESIRAFMAPIIIESEYKKTIAAKLIFSPKPRRIIRIDVANKKRVGK